MKNLFALCTSLLLLTGFAFADVQAGPYKAMETGGVVTFKAWFAITSHPTDSTKVVVKITVDGETVTTTGVAGEKPGTCASMEAIKVTGGHSVRIKDGKSRPQSKKKNASDLNWKTMKKASPGDRSPSAPFEGKGSEEEGVGTLPKTAPPKVSAP